MLWDLIVGVLTFRRGVYAKIEMDATFTTTAWILVVVSAFLNQLGAFASANVGGWLTAAVGGTISMAIAFALGTYVVQWVGRALFDAEVNFGEMIRTLGLAFVWLSVGVVGVLAAFVPALSFLVTLALLVALILALLAWLRAAREALDLPWLQTGVTVVLGFIVVVVIVFGTRIALTGLVSVV